MNTYKVVMYMQRSHRFCNIHTPDDGQDRAERTRITISYGSFIKQLLQDTI